jgi:hypothetical protein
VLNGDRRDRRAELQTRLGQSWHPNLKGRPRNFFPDEVAPHYVMHVKHAIQKLRAAERLGTATGGRASDRGARCDGRGLHVSSNSKHLLAALANCGAFRNTRLERVFGRGGDRTDGTCRPRCLIVLAPKRDLAEWRPNVRDACQVERVR